jgi:voltage-gated potassium channel
MNELRAKLRNVIFGTESKAGKRFDIALLLLILFSLVVVILESVEWINDDYGPYLVIAEWFLTIIFTIEYIIRIYIADKPKGYILSYYGIIDLVAILPTYLSILLAGSQYFMVVRALRLLRVFRILKLGNYTRQAAILMIALRASRQKIIVFIGSVLTIVTIMGTVMYLVEGPAHGFTSIPRSMYWAIVTLTTVGYGDITPLTVLGQFIASIIMIMGYGIIAVPTGIVAAEIATTHDPIDDVICSICESTSHQGDAKYCKNCGNKL